MSLINTFKNAVGSILKDEVGAKILVSTLGVAALAGGAIALRGNADMFDVGFISTFTGGITAGVGLGVASSDARKQGNHDRANILAVLGGMAFAGTAGAIFVGSPVAESMRYPLNSWSPSDLSLGQQAEALAYTLGGAFAGAAVIPAIGAVCMGVEKLAEGVRSIGHWLSPATGSPSSPPSAGNAKPPVPAPVPPQ